MSQLKICTDCPLCEAPSCFRVELIQALVMGGANYVPTNWLGFAEFFNLNGSARSPEETVEHWAYFHPNSLNHTIERVLEYAEAKDHHVLLEKMKKALGVHLVPAHVCSDTASECFRTCEKCCEHPLRQNAWPPSSFQRPSPSEPLPPSPPQHPSSSQPLPSSPHHKSQVVLSRSNSRSAEDLRSAPSQHSGISRHDSNIFHGPVQIYHGPVTIQIPTQGHSEGNSNSAESDGLVSSSFPFLGLSRSAPPSPTLRRSATAPEFSKSFHLSLLRTKKQIERRTTSNVMTVPAAVDDDVIGAGETDSETQDLDNGIETSTIRQRRVTGSHTTAGMGSGPMEKMELALRQAEGETTSLVHSPDCLLTPSPHDEPQVDTMQEFVSTLFDLKLYTFFQQNYHHWFKDTVRVFYALVLLYQGLVIVLLAICEDGGFKTLLHNRENLHWEVTHRILLVFLKIVGRVITPLCFIVQLSTLAARIQVPRTGFTREKVIEKVMAVHKIFSPKEEVLKLDKNSPSFFQETVVMAKRRIRSSWMVIVHSFLFTGLLFYLGAFNIAEEKITRGGVCSIEAVNHTVVTLPVVGVRLHLIGFIDCILLAFVILVIGVVKEFYCYENRIATFAVTTGDLPGKRLFAMIRERWWTLDMFCLVMPLVLTAVILLSLETGKAFSPPPSKEFKASDLATWYFWISVLSILKYLGTSHSRIAKASCLIGYVFIAAFIYSVDIEVVKIPAKGATISILLFTSLAAIVFNLLLSLQQCYSYHAWVTSDAKSQCIRLLCLVYLCLIPLCVVAAMFREVVHFLWHLEQL